MKKTIYLLLLSFLAVSCYEEIILPVGDDQPVGVMNAQLNTMSTSHHVFLSVTRKSKVEALPGADVRVFVNGTQVATAEENPSTYQKQRETIYSFNATFKPGDEVRIEARKDAFSLSASVTVPQPVTISSIDTSTVRMAYMDEVETYLQVKTLFQDIPGSTFYRVTGRMLDDFQYLDDEKNPVPNYSGTVDYTMSVETGFDPVISEGGGKTGGADLASLLAEEYSYHCFSDIPFSGQECTIRPLVYPSFRLGRTAGFPIPDSLQDTDYTDIYHMWREIHRRAFIQLRTMDFSQYHYLKALENLDAFGTDLTFLVEPTTLPTNVEGGLGFVGVETVTEIQFYEDSGVFSPLANVYYDDDGFNYGGYYGYNE